MAGQVVFLSLALLFSVCGAEAPDIWAEELS